MSGRYVAIIGILLLSLLSVQLIERIHAELALWRNEPDEAARLFPKHPIYLNKTLQEKITAAFPPNHQQELESYRKLLSLRPTWPPYWAGLVLRKRALWQYDEEMMQALRHATDLGPWFPQTQKAVLIAGFEGWPFLSPEAVQAVQTALRRALRLQPRETLRLAIDHGFLEQLQPYLDTHDELRELYQKERQARKRRMMETNPDERNE